MPKSLSLSFLVPPLLSVLSHGHSTDLFGPSRSSRNILDRRPYTHPRSFLPPPYRWFGLILLPIASFSADGCLVSVFFARRVISHVRGRSTMLPQELAKARAIDLSVQFALFWTPFLVLLGWWIDKPMHLLFGAYCLVSDNTARR